MESYNVPYKGLRHHYRDLIVIKARAGKTIPIHKPDIGRFVRLNYKPILMEWWEFVMREKLKRELPDGLYTIGQTPFIVQTGKAGYINYEIQLHKEVRKMFFNSYPKPRTYESRK